MTLSPSARTILLFAALCTCLAACYQGKCDLDAKRLSERALKTALVRLPVLTTEIVTDTIREKNPRQFYLSKDTIDLGNYYNNRLRMGYGDFLRSDAWYLKSMNQDHRKELLDLFAVLRKYDLWSAEYDFQLKRYVFYWAKGANYNDDKFVIFLDDSLDRAVLDGSFNVVCDYSPDLVVVTKKF